MTRNLCLFDLDHTLLPIDSDHTFGEFIVRQGWVEPESFRSANNAFYARYQAGTLDIHEYIEYATRPWRHRPADEMAAAQARFHLEDFLGLDLETAPVALPDDGVDLRLVLAGLLERLALHRGRQVLCILQAGSYRAVQFRGTSCRGD